VRRVGIAGRGRNSTMGAICNVLTVAVLLAAINGWPADDYRAGRGSDDPVRPVTFGLFSDIVDLSNTINASFSPDGNTVYFSKSQPGWSGLTIFVAHLKNQKWSEPQVASFSGVYRDTDPAISPDGRALIFSSMRAAAVDKASTYALYRVSLTGSDSGRVDALPESINQAGTNNLYPSLVSDGTLYFMRAEGKVARIYRSRLLGGIYQPPEAVHLPGDSESISDSDPTISVDQRFILFSSNRPDSLGGNDLYIAFRHGDEWCKPLHLDAPINSASPEIATGLSPDGRTLYFASARSAVAQPRAERADATEFKSELNSYRNGTLKTYQANVGAWLDSHAPAGSCN